MHSEHADAAEPAEDRHSETAEQTPTIESLGEELAKAREALDELREAGLRERAELDNQRKRMARELEQARRFANERLLADLLPVFDSLEAGLGAGTGDAARMREGMELTLRQLGKVAAEHGLEVLDPQGEAFDPERHQAMSTVASPEHPDGMVVQVFQKGYRLNQRLLRPALVVVSKAAE